MYAYRVRRDCQGIVWNLKPRRIKSRNEIKCYLLKCPTFNHTEKIDDFQHCKLVEGDDSLGGVTLKAGMIKR